MGKSTITKHFRALGFGVFDADAMVHTLYAEGGEAVSLIGKVFPDVIINNAVDRASLGKKVLDPASGSEALKLIESIVHPLVIAKRKEFYEKAVLRREFLVVYDIPLLFENRAAYEVDYILVATASQEVQRTRVLSRAGMTEQKLDSILAKQIPDEEKRRKADFLVHTDYPGYSESRAQTARAVEGIIAKHPESFQHWATRGRASSSSDGGGGGGASVSAISAIPILRRRFDAVIFDIDETIAAVAGPISAGMAALEEYVERNMPLSAGSIKASLRDAMGSVLRDNPLIAHDLTAVRTMALESIAKAYGEESKVAEAMQTFLSARSNIEPFIYSDVLPCMDWLRAEGLKVALLTNGNCEIAESSALHGRVAFSLSAVDIGAKKPSPVAFMAAAQRIDAPCDRILYIGDSYSCDVLGALAAGMCPALLSRHSDSGPDSNEKSFLSSRGDEANSKFMQIRSLIPNDLIEELKSFYNEA